MTNRHLLIAIVLLVVMSTGIAITLMLRADANATLIRRLTQDMHDLRTIYIPSLEDQLADHRQQLEHLHHHLQPAPATSSVPPAQHDAPTHEQTLAPSHTILPQP